MKRTVIVLADGVEECEALLVVDILRRAKIEVVTASITGRREILSSHGVRFLADALAEEVDFDGADLLVLPGGLPGTTHLAESALVREQCLAFAGNRLLAAICAAPSVLAGLGLLDGKPATCNPAFEGKMGGAVLTRGDVAVAGNIVTGRGLGAAIPFALELAGLLAGRTVAQETARAVGFPPDALPSAPNLP